MRLKIVLIPSLLLLLAAGCKQAAEPVEKAAISAAAADAPATQMPQAQTSKPSQDQGEPLAACAGALSAIAACAEAKTCDEDISSYLPAASRDALIALETQAGYSSEAFDRYCLAACQTKNGTVDEAGLLKDVCGGTGAVKAAEKTAQPNSPSLVGAQFFLRGKLKVGAEGIPLAALLKSLGAPEKKHDTLYDCGSAFDDGSIQEYVYVDFSVETDGDKAFVRSIKLVGANALLLSDGQSIGPIDQTRFKQILGAGAQRYEDAYRVSGSADGSLESAFDFHFDAKGQLVQVDYWIAC